MQKKSFHLGSTRGNNGGPAPATGQGEAAVRLPAGGNNATALSDFLQAQGSSAGNQATALKPYSSNTAVNPLQKQAFNTAQGAVGTAQGAYGNAQGAQNQLQTFANSLADKSNTNITNAMQRGRDSTAMQLSDVRAGAGARGGGPGSGLSGLLQTRAAMSGNRQVNALNADLTEKALGAEQSARQGVITGAAGVTGAANAVTGAASGVTSAAAQAAADQTKRDENASDIWKFSNDFELKKTQADLAQKNYTTDTIMKYLHPFTGSE